MRKILFILLLPLTLFGQSQKISDMTSATTLSGTELVPIVQTTNKKATVSLLRGFGSYGTAGQYMTVNGTANGFTFVTPPFISAYPGAGIAVSTGSAWGTSITDNSANWNTAFGWGNHATAGYQSALTFSSGLTNTAGAVKLGGLIPVLQTSSIRLDDDGFDAGIFKIYDEQLAQDLLVFNTLGTNKITSHTKMGYNSDLFSGTLTDRQIPDWGNVKLKFLEKGTNNITSNISLIPTVAASHNLLFGDYFTNGFDNVFIASERIHFYLNSDDTGSPTTDDFTLYTGSAGNRLMHIANDASFFLNSNNANGFTLSDRAFGNRRIFRVQNTNLYSYQSDGVTSSTLTQDEDGFILDGGFIKLKTSSTVGHIWTASGTDGTGGWAAPALGSFTLAELNTAITDANVENIANKVTALTTMDNDKYPTTASLFARRNVTSADAIVQSDNGKTIYFNSGTPFNFTLDALTVDSQIGFINIGSATVTFVNGSGVTLSGTATLAGGSNASAAIVYTTSTTPLIMQGGAGGGYTNLTSFVDQTPWRLFYSNTSGDVTELAFGASNTYLKSNGVSAAPTFEVISVPDGSYGGVSVGSSGTVWDINAGAVGITQLSASGTPSASTYLRGDNTWATVSGSGLTYSQTKAIAMKIR